MFRLRLADAVVDVTTASDMVVDVSTTCDVPHSDKIALTGTQALQNWIASALASPSVVRPDQVPGRAALLEQLDAIVDFLDLTDTTNGPQAQAISVARSLQTRLESANEKLYEAARAEIRLEGDSRLLRRWLFDSACSRGAEYPIPGLGFDLRDDIAGALFGLCEIEGLELSRSPDMEPYQPTPVRHILDLVAASCLAEDDILIDLGSGLGQVALLVSILSGIRTVGIEFQPAYVVSAQQCARRLNLRRVQFIAADARVADLSIGTVFYLFSPFKGPILADVLGRIRWESREKQIRICSLGPCTRMLADQEWLKASAPPDTKRIAVFRSR